MNDLIIKITGQITDSNFDQWKGDLIKQIQSANKTLATDEDFADAETTVKTLMSAEKSLVDAKQSAVEQAADIQKLFGAIDEISEEARTARLSLQKQIKERKEEIKKDLIEAADRGIYEAIRGASDDVQDALKKAEPGIIYSTAGLHAALKRKKTLTSMTKSLDDYVAESKKRLDAFSSVVDQNRAKLDKIPSEHVSLFQDHDVLLSLSNNELGLFISKRIATFEAEEAKRKAAMLELANRQAEQEKEREQKEREREERAQSQEDSDVTFVTHAGFGHNNPLQELDATTETFTASVYIAGTPEDARKVAVAVNEAVGHMSQVVEIKLRREANAE